MLIIGILTATALRPSSGVLLTDAEALRIVGGADCSGAVANNCTDGCSGSAWGSGSSLPEDHLKPNDVAKTCCGYNCYKLKVDCGT